jgi:hypothetical protein
MNNLKDELDFDGTPEDDDELPFDEASPDGEPKANRRSPELERKIRAAVETMLEVAENPYEAVIVAAQEARRINGRRLKARSIIHQALEQIDELVTEVPLMPRPTVDDEPEVKATNEALEHLALGRVTYDIAGDLKTPPTFAPDIDLSQKDPGESEDS